MNDMQPDNNPMAHSAADEAANDREGAMAKADLYKLANYSVKLFKKLQDEDQLEGWVQAKITKAADYIASVYHYLEYEMKISEYGSHLESAEVYSESKKAELKDKLMEAKAKVAELKKLQAEKLKKDKKEKKVSEGMFGGDQHACEACGGSGYVTTPEREIPEELKAKVAKYNRQAKAMHAASKRLDKNKNGIPDDQEMQEGFDDNAKVGDTFKTQHGTATKTSTGVKHTRDAKPEDDEDYEAPKKPSKAAKTAAEKKADKEREIKLPKPAKGTRVYGIKNGEKFEKTIKESDKGDMDHDGKDEPDSKEYLDNKDAAIKKAMGKKEKKVDEAAKPDFLDMDKDGNKKEPMKKAVADKKKTKKVDENIVAKALKMLGKGKQQPAATPTPTPAPTPAHLQPKPIQLPDDAVKQFSPNMHARIAKASDSELQQMAQNFGGPGFPAHIDYEYALLKKAQQQLRAASGAVQESSLVAESAEVSRLKELTQRLLG